MDPYAPCPCGSGRKLKFCCQDIIGEMEKIERLQENNQPRMALQLLEKIDRTHPRHPWISTRRASILLEEEQPQAAAAALVEFLRAAPDHPLANALYAYAVLIAEGYPAAKKAVHRAFRRSIGDEPGLVAALASGLAEAHLELDHRIAARQHLALALRLADEEQRARTFRALLELDGDPSVPGPLRGAHHLPRFSGPESVRDDVEKAYRLSEVGCWQEAADVLMKVSAQDPECAELWTAIGLLRAWDGDEAAAAEALHRAARLPQDFDAAVEAETIAQLLDGKAPDRQIKVRVRRYAVESVSRLLTLLDGADACVRLPIPPSARESPLAGIYQVADRAIPPDEDLSRLTMETVPREWGRLHVFDRSEEPQVPARAVLTAAEGEPLGQAERILMGAAAGLLTPMVVPAAEADDDVVGLIPRDWSPFEKRWLFPPGTPDRVRRALLHESWRSVLHETWPETPLAALGGRSPTQAAGDPECRVALAAAVEVLDAYCSGHHYIADLDGLRERLGVPRPGPVKLTDGRTLASLSPGQFRRLDLRDVTDEQLTPVLQRAKLMGHPAQLYAALQERLGRTDDEEHAEERHTLIAALARVCSDALRQEEALEWLHRARELADRRGNYESSILLRFQEVATRARDRDDPELRALLLDLWNNFAPKVPALRETLQRLTDELGLESPWDSAIVTRETVGASAAEWSVAAGSPDADAGRKLWLPGDQ